MKQIGDAKPEILDLFPCFLTKFNAIDKKLMNLVIHCAVKGIGPSSMAENLASWHELEWQKRENLWALYILRRIQNPTLMQKPINRNEIEKCPDYFSIELGGCVPSGQWMVEMFCL